jgi:hypothetical protein
MSVEKNTSPWTPRDVEAFNLAGELRKKDEQGLINIDHIRYLRQRIIAEWEGKGYDPHLFADEEGLPVILGRHEDSAMFDDEGSIKPERGVRYRFYLDEGTRDVTVPAALTGVVPAAMGEGTVTIYDTTSSEALEAVVSDDAAAVFTDDMEWLVRHFGRSLTIVRRLRAPTRLETDEKVVGIALNDLALFEEGDF